MIVKSKKCISVLLCISLSLVYFYFIFNVLSDCLSKKKLIEAWKMDCIFNKIETISFVFTDESYKIKGRRGFGWTKVKYVYINNIKIPTKTLYRKNDFLKKHCNKYYMLGFYGSEDSVVYKMPPEDIICIFRKRKFSPDLTIKGCCPLERDYDQVNINSKSLNTYLPNCQKPF